MIWNIQQMNDQWTWIIHKYNFCYIKKVYGCKNIQLISTWYYPETCIWYIQWKNDQCTCIFIINKPHHYHVYKLFQMCWSSQQNIFLQSTHINLDIFFIFFLHIYIYIYIYNHRGFYRWNIFICYFKYTFSMPYYCSYIKLKNVYVFKTRRYLYCNQLRTKHIYIPLYTN